MKNDNGNIPKTEKELEEWMKANCANFNSYSINGNAIYEGFGIEIIGDRKSTRLNSSHWNKSRMPSSA